MATKTKIYISGKISGLETEEVKSLFNQAEQSLKLRGFETVNPLDVLPYQEHLTWEDYMIADIKALFDCKAIFMLTNWKDSRGARIEHNIANELGLRIIYQ